MMDNNDTMQRFLDAHEYGYCGCSNYQTALDEIQNGDKQTHWMWYIFPQLSGIARYPSTISRYFELDGEKEAQAFIRHPVLRAHLCEISHALMSLDTCDPVTVFGQVDAFKFRSCMTLFSILAPEETVFAEALERYCMGIRDEKTMRLLHRT